MSHAGRIGYSRILRLLYVLALVAAGLQAADLKFHAVSRDVVERRLESIRTKNGERQVQIVQLFHDAGCVDVSEKPIRKKGAANVVCVLPGKSSRQILVGAHFDKVSMGDGAVDNWTGAALLSSLYQAVLPLERRHTFVFASFGDEELGLLGSQAYVKNLDTSEIAAMVNIDSLGLSSTKVWVSRSDTRFVGWAANVANALKVPLDGVNADQVGRSDSFPFHDKKVPTIDFHSLTPETMRILHSPWDVLKAVNRDVYYDSYRLIAAFLALLDQTLPVPATN